MGGRDKGSFYLRQNDAFYALSPSSEFPPPLMDRCNNLLSYSSLLRQKPCSLKPLERERGCRFPTKQTNVPRGGGGGGGREGWGNEYVTCGEAGEREVSACLGKLPAAVYINHIRKSQEEHHSSHPSALRRRRRPL